VLAGCSTIFDILRNLFEGFLSTNKFLEKSAFSCKPTANEGGQNIYKKKAARSETTNFLLNYCVSKLMPFFSHFNGFLFAHKPCGDEEAFFHISHRREM
jgi:hypothetical protein